MNQNQRKKRKIRRRIRREYQTTKQGDKHRYFFGSAYGRVRCMPVCEWRGRGSRIHTRTSTHTHGEGEMRTCKVNFGDFFGQKEANGELKGEEEGKR